MAHLLELPNKINLSREDYLTVQQIYRGWNLLAVVVFGALLSTLALTITVRRQRRAFIFADRLPLHRRHSDRVLDLHLSGESDYKQLDHSS